MNVKIGSPLKRRFCSLLLGLAMLAGHGRMVQAASPPGDVVGKVTVGYQGWFATNGDGSPLNNWWHWSPNAAQAPSPSNNDIPIWPDMREYTTVFQSGFANLGNGKPATLFSNYTDQTVNTQFRWMQQNGIDTAALQRFNPTGYEGPIRNAISTKVKNAAQATGRKFYIMYDISGWTNFNAEIKSDWDNVIVNQLGLTASSAYARQNNKPVVCIWGMGFTDRPGDAATCLNLINWFKGKGIYVIGGVPTWWRTAPANSDSKTGFLGVYSAFSMISPWMVGRIGNVGDSDSYRANVNNGDITYCNNNGIDYQPCVLPGDSGQRVHGDLMWRQFYNMIQLGAHGLYISMFDEYNEGNQIAKSAEDASMKPTNSTSFTLDQDGVHCSSDFYLRLTGDGGRMLKGQIPLTSTHPTRHVLAFSIKSNLNNQYVCAEGGGNQTVVANRAAVGIWETFGIIDTNAGDIQNNDIIHLRAYNGSFLCADNAGGGTLFADRAIPSGWEEFTVIKTSGSGVIANGNTVAFRSQGGKYLTVVSSGGAVNVTGTSIGTAQTFTVNYVS